MKETGRIIKISGPTVVAGGLPGACMYNRVLVGDLGLLGEVIRVEADRATIQVYEDTTGLSLGEKVLDEGLPLQVELGPGLLGSVFDGVQRPLPRIYEEKGDRVSRGVVFPALSRSAEWKFKPLVKKGDRVQPGDVLGVISENPRIEHKVLVPFKISGSIKTIRKGLFRVSDPIGELDDGTELFMLQKWPVRTPRPFSRKLRALSPFLTGQRVFDSLFPVASGGTAVVPGGFGTGKTVVEQTLARYADSDVIVYVGCGERGNEMTEVLRDFPDLIDPRTKRPLMERTVLVVNTSNMPVAAREASIYTGITMAEYFRDMGYRVALMADSTSRWAEALREISARLEEMPGEEGYPTYLGTRLAGFYERGGQVECLGKGDRTGTVTIVSAISPPGGDFSEPVTQSSVRIAGTMWALDSGLANRRHFPAIDWKKSYSLYLEDLREWYLENVAPDWLEVRRGIIELLQKEEEIQEIVQLVGVDALQDQERVTLEAGRMIREDFLRQSAFSPVDA
ncbi:MAG TPA: V-type ATP synthase subunit A, partial [Nitrospiria bacterium]|nr:V-type ATP synthase subunit A [Nitrospiria bacterium]